MKFHCLLASAAFAASASFIGDIGAVQAAPTSSLLQAAPSIRALETPAADDQGVEKAYYYRRYYHRRYYRPYYHRYYRHYYYHPHYYGRYYYRPYYRYHYWHPFYW